MTLEWRAGMMFATWNSVVHIILLQAAIAFYYLIWPLLKKVLLWKGLRLWWRGQDPVSDQASTTRPSCDRDKWWKARDHKAEQSDRERRASNGQRAFAARQALDPLKSKHLNTLGLREPVHLIDIKSAYRQMAKSYHPDRYASADYTESARQAAAQKMRDINAAYDWLRVNA